MRKAKKGLLIFFALFLISSEIHAGVPPAILGAAASSSAAAARRRRERHKLQYHNGPMTCYVEEVEAWSWKKPYEISFYEKEYYYYQGDPDRCVQYVKENFKGKRFATEQETYEHDLHLKYLLFGIAVILTIFIGVIVGSCIYDKVKKRRQKQNDRDSD